MTPQATFKDTVLARSSCREFRPEPVPESLLAEVFGLAQRAPSWCNTQPWHVTVTADIVATKRFAHALTAHVEAPGAEPEPDIDMPDTYTGAHALRRRESGLQLYSALGITREDSAARRSQGLRNFAFFDAPHVAIITVDRELGPYALVDAGVYVGHLVLAASHFGLGSVAQAAIARHAGFVRQYFELPTTESVVLAVSLGWPKPDAAANQFRTGRADLSEVVRGLRTSASVTVDSQSVCQAARTR